MRIRTRVYLGVAPSVLLVLVAAVALYWSDRQLGQAIMMSAVGDQIVHATFDLSALRDEYALRPTERAHRQWERRFESRDRLLAEARFDQAEDQQLLVRIRALHADGLPLFQQLVQNSQEGVATAPDGAVRAELVRRLVGQLTAKSQSLLSDSQRLSARNRERVETIHRRSQALVLALSVIAVLLVAGNSWIVIRTVLRPVERLRQGAELVRRGKLEHRVDTGTSDELGDLARGFDRMTAELAAALSGLEQRARQFRGLSEAALRVNSVRSIQEILQFITDQARLLIGAHQAVTSFTVDQNWSQAITGLSLSDKYAEYRTYDVKPDGSGIYALVCESNRPLRMTQAELAAHPRWRGFGQEAGRHPAMRGWLAAPLVGGDGRNLGLVQLSDKLEGEFTDDDEAILVQLAQMASVALEIRRFQEGLEQRVKERTAKLAERTLELEELGKLATGREMRMIELKCHVNDLARQMGKPEPYDVSFARE